MNQAEATEMVQKLDAALPAIMDDAIQVSTEPVDDDLVVLSVKDEEPPDSVLKAVLWGLAEEQSSLRSLRQKKKTDGKDYSNISMRRGMLLKYMSETLLQKQALQGPSGDLDLKGPKFREIFKMFLESISDSFDQAKIPIEYKEIFFQTLSKNLEGWEDRAEKVVKALEAPKLLG